MEKKKKRVILGTNEMYPVADVENLDSVNYFSGKGKGSNSCLMFRFEHQEFPLVLGIGA